jgi:hypothetical protein
MKVTEQGRWPTVTGRCRCARRCICADGGDGAQGSKLGLECVGEESALVRIEGFTRVD